jgi:hypothetical protein
MAELFAHGSIVAWILAFMLAEGCLLLLLRAKTHLPLLDLAASLGAGAALLLALRAALRGDSWHLIALWLLIALAAHLLDLQRRLHSTRTLQRMVNS